MARTDAVASAAAESARDRRRPRTDDGPAPRYHVHWLATGVLLGLAGWALIGALISFVFGPRWLAAGLAVLAFALVAALLLWTAGAKRRVQAKLGRSGQPTPRVQPLPDS
jgi:Flp pilus assembly protein TadB